jgi:NADH:ubiquinone oxidoreductase subunit 5 (subunit L)/multisubunit Na+/H+ antiporter MnhA subunit
MPAIFLLALVLVAILAAIVIGSAVHLLFSPWLLLAVAIFALIKFWPRRSRQ